MQVVFNFQFPGLQFSNSRYKRDWKRANFGKRAKRFQPSDTLKKRVCGCRCSSIDQVDNDLQIRFGSKVFELQSLGLLGALNSAATFTAATDEPIRRASPSVD